MSATSTRAPARERLLEAALTRFGADDPVAVTLEDVRQTAGVSVGALYHHFTDKVALLDALYLELTSQVQAEFLDVVRTHPDAEAGVKAVVRHYLRWVSKNRAGAGVLLGHRPAGPELKELNRRFFGDVLAWWQTHVHYGTLRELPLELIHALWLGPAQEYTRHWLAGHTRRPPSAVVNVLGDAAWNALKENAR
jgi:AcrR family transcriptional regulator